MHRFRLRVIVQCFCLQSVTCEFCMCCATGYCTMSADCQVCWTEVACMNMHNTRVTACTQLSGGNSAQNCVNPTDQSPPDNAYCALSKGLAHCIDSTPSEHVTSGSASQGTSSQHDYHACSDTMITVAAAATNIIYISMMQQLTHYKSLILSCEQQNGLI